MYFLYRFCTLNDKPNSFDTSLCIGAGTIFRLGEQKLVFSPLHSLPFPPQQVRAEPGHQTVFGEFQDKKISPSSTVATIFRSFSGNETSNWGTARLV